MGLQGDGHDLPTNKNKTYTFQVSFPSVLFIPLNYCFLCRTTVFSVVITIIFMCSDLPSFLLGALALERYPG